MGEGNFISCDVVPSPGDLILTPHQELRHSLLISLLHNRHEAFQLWGETVKERGRVEIPIVCTAQYLIQVVKAPSDLVVVVGGRDCGELARTRACESAKVCVLKRAQESVCVCACV